MLLQTILTISCLISFTAATQRAAVPIGQVFDIIGCDEIYDAGISAQEDPDTRAFQTDPRTRLIRWWDDINVVSQEMDIALMNGEYAQDNVLRKLFRAFFGVKPSKTSPGYYPMPDVQGEEVDARILGVVMAGYQAIEARLNSPINEYAKPKLFCKADHLRYQSGNDDALDAYGEPIPKDNEDLSKGYYSLAEWLTLKGQALDLQRNHIFHYGVQSEHSRPAAMRQNWDTGYVMIDKSFITTEAGLTDPCQGGFRGITLWPNVLSPDAPPQVIVCLAQILARSQRDGIPDDIDWEKQEMGTDLEEMETNGFVLWHECVHLFLGGDETPDAPFPRCRTRNSDGSPKRLSADRHIWPDDRETWDPTWLASGAGPIYALHVAAYDRSIQGRMEGRPTEMGFDRMRAVRNPENYVWGGLANAFRRYPGQDWSFGEVGEASLPFRGVSPVKRAVNASMVYSKFV